MVQKTAGPGIPGVHVQARPEQDSATGPKIKPKAASASKDFPLPSDWEATPKLETSILNLSIPKFG